MRCVGYVLRGVLSGQNPATIIEIEQNPEDFNIDLMIKVIADDYEEDMAEIHYAYPIWRVDSGMSEEMRKSTKDYFSIFENNIAYIKYCDGVSDEIHVYLEDPVEIQDAVIMLSDRDAKGNLDQTFIMEDGTFCNLTSLSTYIEVETDKPQEK